MQKLPLMALTLLVALGLVAPVAASVTGSGSLSPEARMAQKANQAQSANLLVAKRRRKRKPRVNNPPPPPPQPDPAPADNGGGAPIMTTRRGPARVDFDDRLIQGQTNKSGAIYIFERKSSELRSMVRRRTSFREEIYRSID